MKRSLLSIALLMVAVCSFAAIKQTGYVKTRGRLGSNGQVIPGKRLGAATVILQNGSSVASDQSGDFTLTLPANKFFLKSVKKDGYIVADPDILSKEYAYSANPLVLVLDEPTSQQDDRLASERALRRNLQKQLQQREDELEALKEENKITQEQYREALQKIYDDQQSNEKFIAEMAERYSKIDFEQLDEFQKQFAAFIQNGELVRADSLLHTKGSMDERKNEIIRLQNANREEENELAERGKKLSDSKKTEAVLLSEYDTYCYNHFELCKLKFDNDSAAYWLEQRVEMFPDNIAYQLEAGNFISSYLANYELALKYYTQALTLAEQKYGEKHPDVAQSYNNIGWIYDEQGNYDLALEYFEKALNIQLGIFGENHPNTALSYNNIGYIYYSQGDSDQALEYYEKDLNIWLGISGQNHPDVASRYYSIGVVYFYQGDYDQALEYYEKALNIWLGIFGQNHPDIASTYNSIGLVYYSQGDYDQALEYYEKALNSRLGIFGQNHPDVARSYNSIGIVYTSQRNYDRALVNYEKTLNIRLGIFGQNHPDVASSYNNIGVIYAIQRNYDRALEYYQKALEIQLEIFDENHPDVEASYNNIGVVYDNQGDYAIALEYYEKALNILLGIFDENHPDVQKAKDKISTVKGKMTEQ